MIYINNCKLLIIIGAKILKNINYSIIHPTHRSHPPLCPCGSHPTAPTTPTPSPPVCLVSPFQLVPLRGFGGYPIPPIAPIPARAARTPRVSPSLSESLRVFIKKYSPHFQLTTKNFQKKLRKNLQDKKNAVPLHPQMRQNIVSKQETTRTLT